MTRLFIEGGWYDPREFTSLVQTAIEHAETGDSRGRISAGSRMLLAADLILTLRRKFFLDSASISFAEDRPLPDDLRTVNVGDLVLTPTYHKEAIVERVNGYLVEIVWSFHPHVEYATRPIFDFTWLDDIQAWEAAPR